MPVYFIQALFSDGAAIDDALRGRHIHYVKSKTEQIRYGGVLSSGTREYEGICYFFFAHDRDEAEKFIEDDPYFSLYSRVSINRFMQRIPQE